MAWSGGNTELEFLPTTLVVVLMKVVFPFIPKVEFNFEVITLVLSVQFLCPK